MKKILSRSTFSRLALACGILVLSLSAAQAKPLDLTAASTSYEIAMTYYKLINRQPDFASWIKEDPRYIQAQPEDQPGIMAEETQKLAAAFTALDPKKTILVVRTQARMMVATNPKDNRKTLKVEFQGQGPVYFPYLVGGQNITLIPNGIDIYREIPVSDADAARIQSLIDYRSIGNLVIEVVPTSAEGRGPVMLDSVPQWLMLGEIGYIGFYNDRTDEMWSSQAPGYVRKDAGKIFSLHSQNGSAPATDLEALKP